MTVETASLLTTAIWNVIAPIFCPSKCLKCNEVYWVVLWRIGVKTEIKRYPNQKKVQDKTLTFILWQEMVKSSKYLFFKGRERKKSSFNRAEKLSFAFLFCRLNQSAEILIFHSAVFPFGCLAIQDICGIALSYFIVHSTSNINWCMKSQSKDLLYWKVMMKPWNMQS